MSFPNAGPQLPSPQLPVGPTPDVMTMPPAVANLGCMGCGSTLPSLGEVVKPPMPTWLKIFGVMLFFGGVFGLLAFTSRKQPRFPARP